VYFVGDGEAATSLPRRMQNISAMSLVLEDPRSKQGCRREHARRSASDEVVGMIRG
jgi:hypothetical protein